MSSREYVVIPTGFVVAYRTCKGDYVAISEHFSGKSAEEQCRALNAAESATTNQTKQLIAAALNRRPARVFEAEGVL